MATNPYLKVIKQIVANAVSDRQAADQQSDAQERQAYINYMNAQKNLATGLANQGISGGGSESALLGANVGYQNTLNTVSGQKANALADISRDATANQLAAESQSAAWVENAQARDEERFANTITGYDTIAKCDNAIAAAQANGQTWKIPYLKAQRAALKEQQKQQVSTSSGSGYRKSSSSSSVSTNPLAEYQVIASTKGIPFSSGGISGTQGGMTPVYYPNRPLTR